MLKLSELARHKILPLMAQYLSEHLCLLQPDTATLIDFVVSVPMETRNYHGGHNYKVLHMSEDCLFAPPHYFSSCQIDLQIDFRAPSFRKPQSAQCP